MVYETKSKHITSQQVPPCSKVIFVKAIRVPQFRSCFARILAARTPSRFQFSVGGDTLFDILKAFFLRKGFHELRNLLAIQRLDCRLA